MVKRVDVKINIIAIDFLNEYDPTMDDPNKPDLMEVLNNNILSADYSSQELSLNSRLLYFMT